ncbi:MAG: aldo/keto reductase [Pseudomonadota bacterium]
MERISLSEDLDFSRIIYGMWRIKDGDEDTSVPHVRAKIDACLDQGITTIDQADIYGDYGAEAVLGSVLKDAPALRDQIEIVTKCDIIAPIGYHSDKRVKYYDTSAEYVTGALERSLTEMSVEAVDLLLIHRPDPFMDADVTGPALDALVDSGKTKAIGVSNFRPWDFELLQSRMDHPLLTNQIEISVLETSSFTNGDLAYAQTHRLPPMAWSPLGGGALFDGSNAKLTKVLTRIAGEQNADMTAIAVAWLIAHPARIMPVMGTNNLDRIKALGKAMDVALDRQTWFEIYEAANGAEVP